MLCADAYILTDLTNLLTCGPFSGRRTGLPTGLSTPLVDKKCGAGAVICAAEAGAFRAALCTSHLAPRPQPAPTTGFRDVSRWAKRHEKAARSRPAPSGKKPEAEKLTPQLAPGDTQFPQCARTHRRCSFYPRLLEFPLTQFFCVSLRL
jgi:hypothetical protein